MFSIIMMERKKRRSRLMENLEKKVEQLLARIQCYNLETKNHCVNVQAYSLLIGKQLGISDSELKILEVASLLHDIGKIYIPFSITLKPGKLNKREEVFMRRHSSYGYEYLKYHNIPEEIAACVLEHHEYIDGSGYPNHLNGNQIHTVTKILQVADVYDALASDRPYRKAYSTNEIIAEITKGKYFENAVEVIVNSIKNEKAFHVE